MRYVVAVYEVDQAYGGPEEGGWWYDTGKLIDIVKVVKGEHRAWEVAARMNRLFHYRRKARGQRSYTSCAYSGGYYRAEVFEREAPGAFPLHRPHYE